MKIIKPVQRVIDGFESLPGIGPKSAARLAYYLLHVPQERIERFADSLTNLRRETKTCKVCFNVDEEELCTICRDADRDQTTICVVERPLDLIAFEKAEVYRGTYHVLGGVINPLLRIGPDELFLGELLTRIKSGKIKELILATNPSMEGEATAMYIQNKVEDLKNKGLIPKIVITRIGRGLSTGAEVEYADGMTLARALEGRREI